MRFINFVDGRQIRYPQATKDDIWAASAYQPITRRSNPPFLKHYVHQRFRSDLACGSSYAWKMTVQIPLCVNPEGTLFRTNTLLESTLLFLKQRPLSIFRIPFWRLQ